MYAKLSHRNFYKCTSGKFLYFFIIKYLLYLKSFLFLNPILLILLLSHLQLIKRNNKLKLENLTSFENPRKSFKSIDDSTENTNSL